VDGNYRDFVRTGDRFFVLARLCFDRSLLKKSGTTYQIVRRIHPLREGGYEKQPPLLNAILLFGYQPWSLSESLRKQRLVLHRRIRDGNRG
jgi:hypothetical protein